MNVKFKGDFCLACAAKIEQLLREEVRIPESKDDCKAMRRMVWGRDVPADLEPCVGLLGGKGFFRASPADLKETGRVALAKIDALQAQVRRIFLDLGLEDFLEEYKEPVRCDKNGT